MLQSRKESLREGKASIPQLRKESLKDTGNVCPLVGTTPPRRKDSDRLPSLPPQRDDGYEAVQMPQRPSQPKPTPKTPGDSSSSEYFTPPPRPQKPTGSSSTAAPVDNSIPQQTASPVRPGCGSSSSANAYETVAIVPPRQGTESSSISTGSDGDSLSSDKPRRPPKPGSSSGDSSSIYQQPRAPVSVITSRDDVYDNVHIRNVPLTTKDGQTSSGEANELGISESDAVSSLSPEVKKEELEATDGKLEIDSGGMGCKDIASAMEERRQILKEMESKEGVVLLSVQKVKEQSSVQLETYGMCLLFKNAFTSIRIICLSAA